MKLLRPKRASFKTLSDALIEHDNYPKDDDPQAVDERLSDERSHSSPAICMMPKPCDNQLELLDETQLTKLTRSNTKKNVGGRKRRFRSQLERVCRKLDNLAIDAKLQSRLCLDALPVVSPDTAARVDALVFSEAVCEQGDAGESQKSLKFESSPPSRKSSPHSKKSSPKTVMHAAEDKTSSDDSFAIEPATNDSIFSSPSAKSVLSNGPKSVRISTSVVVLDYEQSDAQPVSVSKLERFDHPTRNDKNSQLRKANAQDVAFQKARIRRLAGAIQDARDLGKLTNETESNSACESVDKSCPLQVDLVKRPATPKTRVHVAYASPCPNGPYGPPLPK